MSSVSEIYKEGSAAAIQLYNNSLAKAHEVSDNIRQKCSLVLFKAFTTGAQMLNKEDMESYFYQKTNIHLSELKMGECRRKDGKVTGLRIENPITGQPYFYE